MIYTCTLNPAIDLVMHSQQPLEPTIVHRTSSWQASANGKGINVSNVLKTLHVCSTAIGFIAGFTGRFIQESLTQANIHHHFIETAGLTRINAFLQCYNDQTNHSQEFKIMNAGAKAKSDEQIALLDFISKHISSEDIFILSGSYLGVVDQSFVEQLLTVLKEKGSSLIFDVDDPLLFTKALEHTALLLKPSHEEFARFFNINEQDKEALLNKGIEVVEQYQLPNLIISMGGDGAFYITPQDAWYGNAPTGTVVNTSCAGDTMLATFSAKLFVNKLSATEAFSYALAAGSSAAFVPLLSNLEDVETLRKQVVIRPAKDFLNETRRGINV